MTQPKRQDELTTAEREGAKSRFMAKVEVTPVGHWLWRASKDCHGHGWFRLATRYNATNSHRAAWLLWVDDLPGDWAVLAPCRRDGCVAPSHLRLREALAHRAESLRNANAAWRGTPSPSRKLDPAKARRALRMLRGGWLQRQVAARLGVSTALISFVAQGRAWTSATGLERRR